MPMAGGHGLCEARTCPEVRVGEESYAQPLLCLQQRQAESPEARVHVVLPAVYASYQH